MADTGPLAAFGIPLVRNEVWVNLIILKRKN